MLMQASLGNMSFSRKILQSKAEITSDIYSSLGQKAKLDIV